MSSGHDTSLPSASAEEVAELRARVEETFGDTVALAADFADLRRRVRALEAQTKGGDAHDPGRADAKARQDARQVAPPASRVGAGGSEPFDFPQQMDKAWEDARRHAEARGEDFDALHQDAADRLGNLADDPGLPPWWVEPQPTTIAPVQAIRWESPEGRVIISDGDSDADDAMIAAAGPEYAGGEVVELTEKDSPPLGDETWKGAGFYVIAPKLVRVPGKDAPKCWEWDLCGRWSVEPLPGGVTTEEARNILAGRGYPGARPIGDAWWYQPEAESNDIRAKVYRWQEEARSESAPLQSTTAAEKRSKAPRCRACMDSGVVADPDQEWAVMECTECPRPKAAQPVPSPGLSPEDARECVRIARDVSPKLRSGSLMPAWHGLIAHLEAIANCQPVRVPIGPQMPPADELALAAEALWSSAFGKNLGHLERVGDYISALAEASGQPPACSGCEGRDEAINGQREIIDHLTAKAEALRERAERAAEDTAGWPQQFERQRDKNMELRHTLYLAMHWGRQACNNLAASVVAAKGWREVAERSRNVCQKLLANPRDWSWKELEAAAERALGTEGEA